MPQGVQAEAPAKRGGRYTLINRVLSHCLNLSPSIALHYLRSLPSIPCDVRPRESPSRAAADIRPRPDPGPFVGWPRHHRKLWAQSTIQARRIDRAYGLACMNRGPEAHLWSRRRIRRRRVCIRTRLQRRKRKEVDSKNELCRCIHCACVICICNLAADHRYPPAGGSTARTLTRTGFAWSCRLRGESEAEQSYFSVYS